MLPTLDGLLAWAHDPRVRARPGQRPLSNGPFARYGGYRAFLQRTGLIPADGRCDARGRILPLVHKYADGELVVAVREVAARLGHTPSEAEYRRERVKIVEETAAAGSQRIVAAVSTLTKRFGPWPNVIAAARLDPRAGRVPPAGPERRAPRYSGEEKLEWLRRAWPAVGGPFTKAAYDRWRDDELARAAERGEFLRIPSGGTICVPYGGWKRACEGASGILCMHDP